MILAEGFHYLVEKAAEEKISEEIILEHLHDWKSRKPTKINGKNGLFYNMVGHAKNRRNMLSYFEAKENKSSKNNNSKIDYLNESLLGYNPKSVLDKYSKIDNPWEKGNLLDNIDTELAKLLEIDPTNKDLQKLKNSINKQKINNQESSYWVIFSKSIISIANFLSKFSTIDEFNKFVDDFNLNDNTRISLALLLENEIFGYGFALACDFLKENCNQQYAKPDTHIKYIFDNLILCGRKLTGKNEDIEYYRAFMKYFESIHNFPYETDKLFPYEVDKLFWLIGSGNLYRENKMIKTSREDFVERVNKVVMQK